MCSSDLLSCSSIGVHLLNLLCLPAIVLVYYYKKVPNANAKGSLLALLASGILVAAVLYGMVPGIVKVGGWFELFFVNTLGMSFNSGVMVYIIYNIRNNRTRCRKLSCTASVKHCISEYIAMYKNRIKDIIYAIQWM